MRTKKWTNFALILIEEWIEYFKHHNKENKTSYHRFQMNRPFGEVVPFSNGSFTCDLTPVILWFDERTIMRSDKINVEKYDRGCWWNFQNSIVFLCLPFIDGDQQTFFLFLLISIKWKMYLEVFVFLNIRFGLNFIQLTKTIEHWSRMARRRCAFAPKTDWQRDIVSRAFVYTQYGMTFN